AASCGALLLPDTHPSHPRLRSAGGGTGLPLRPSASSFEIERPRSGLRRRIDTRRRTRVPKGTSRA
ncbi:unnamed protein product, partial [Musa acuminata subsp. burmannicoides]